ncbi:hypothetical protein VTK26DRAFT_3445 [Humicola hyalothermophila]
MRYTREQSIMEPRSRAAWLVSIYIRLGNRSYHHTGGLCTRRPKAVPDGPRAAGPFGGRPYGRGPGSFLRFSPAEFGNQNRGQSTYKSSAERPGRTSVLYRAQLLGVQSGDPHHAIKCFPAIRSRSLRSHQTGSCPTLHSTHSLIAVCNHQRG